MTPQAFASLLQAYHDTDYWVKVGSTMLCIKPGSSNFWLQLSLESQRDNHSEIDALSQAVNLNPSSGCIISAANPASQRLSKGENDRRHQALAQLIKNTGKPHWPSIAKASPSAEYWPDEPGFLVWNISQQDCIDWCQRFQQFAVVFLQYSMAAHLAFWCEHENLKPLFTNKDVSQRAVSAKSSIDFFCLNTESCPKWRCVD